MGPPQNVGLGGDYEDSEYPWVVRNKVPTGGLCCPFNVTSVKVVVPPAIHPGGKKLHGAHQGGACW